MNKSLIPRIFHFTWKKESDLDNQFITLIDPKGEKKSLRWCINTFIEKNPDWQYKFWSDEDVNKFILEEYPLFFNFWKELKTIEKFDIFRYMCLYKFGGAFVDVDCICVRPLDEFLDHFFPDANLIAGQEMEQLSNWINYPPHIQLNIWSIFSVKENYHLRNLISFIVGNCLTNPKMPVIEKTSMAAFGDYIYRAAKSDDKIKIVSTSFLSMDGRFKYMHQNSFGTDDNLPAYILHGYYSSWIDDDFKRYADIMNTRDNKLLNENTKNN